MTKSGQGQPAKGNQRAFLPQDGAFGLPLSPASQRLTVQYMLICSRVPRLPCHLSQGPGFALEMAGGQGHPVTRLPPGGTGGGWQEPRCPGGPRGGDRPSSCSAPLPHGEAEPVAIATPRPPPPLFESSRAPAHFAAAAAPPMETRSPTLAPPPASGWSLAAQSSGRSPRRSDQSEQTLPLRPLPLNPPVPRTDGRRGWPMRRRAWLRLVQ